LFLLEQKWFEFKTLRLESNTRFINLNYNNRYRKAGKFGENKDCHFAKEQIRGMKIFAKKLETPIWEKHGNAIFQNYTNQAFLILMPHYF
jgi:hypothetical protein